MNTVQLIHQSNSAEWFTPRPYIEAVRCALGAIDLDPASCGEANRTVQAARYFTRENNGLMRPWRGRVFCNPPYGGEQARFSKKMIEEFRCGHMTAGVLLVKAATDCRWFQPLWGFPLCFVSRRIRFDTPEGVENRNRPSIGSVFVYFGQEPERFYAAFRQFGRCGTLAFSYHSLMYPRKGGRKEWKLEPSR